MAPLPEDSLDACAYTHTHTHTLTHSLTHTHTHTLNTRKNAHTHMQAYMRKRKPLSLRWATALHNLALCLGSAAMFVVAVVATWRRARSQGVAEVFCSRSAPAPTSTPDPSATGLLFFTMYAYYLSKFWELLDTVILVLKKKPLIFLHYYHHAIVILMVWTWLEWGIPFAALGMIANTLIHVFMYYYYGVTSLGYRVWFKRYLTSAQIVQFAASFLLALPYLYLHVTRGGCHGFQAFLFSMAVNATFLLLFIQFYASAYGGKQAKRE
jgi:fatty acid elongase 3